MDQIISSAGADLDATIEDVRVLTVSLLDEHGTEHDLRVDEEDWIAALALTPNWSVFDHYGKPIVASRGGAAILHPKRNRRCMWLTLAEFIAFPAYGDTVRHLDGDTLNCTAPNLVARPRWSRTIPLPPSAKETAFLDRVAARLGWDKSTDQVFGTNPSALAAPASASKRKRKRRPGALRTTAGNA